MFDIAIKNGLIVDGSGAPAYRAALYIQDNRIAKIDPDETLDAKETVDANGMMVSPGFIDMHTHSDSTPWTAPGYEGRLHQGVTTDIAGNCGSSLIPKKVQTESVIKCHCLAEMKEELKTKAFGANTGTFIGHGTLRSFCLTDPYAPIPLKHEMEAMKNVLRKEMENGAMGMSLGLVYMPGMCCETSELIELAKVVAEFNGVVSVHMRGEDERIFSSLEEVHRIAAVSGAHLHISHLKVSHKINWGKSEAVLEMIDAMQKDSLVTADQYPFTAFNTTIKTLIPTWAKKGTNEEITARFDVEEYWPELKECIESRIGLVGSPDLYMISTTNGMWPEIEGMRLNEIANMFGTSVPEAFRMIMKRCNSNVSAITFSMCDEDVIKFMCREDIAVISDSGSSDFVTGKQIGKPHPRSTSSAVRFLRLVRENNLMPIEKAVAKLTSVPANILGLKDRGLLSKGYYADVVIFDPEKVAERGVYGDPFHTAVGIDKVFVNGALAWSDGKPGKRNGMIVERQY